MIIGWTEPTRQAARVLLGTFECIGLLTISYSAVALSLFLKLESYDKHIAIRPGHKSGKTKFTKQQATQQIHQHRN
jgi:hypothetical protein